MLKSSYTRIFFALRNSKLQPFYHEEWTDVKPICHAAVEDPQPRRSPSFDSFNPFDCGWSI
jgi:hypothetical protein